MDIKNGFLDYLETLERLALLGMAHETITHGFNGDLYQLSHLIDKTKNEPLIKKFEETFGFLKSLLGDEKYSMRNYVTPEETNNYLKKIYKGIKIQVTGEIPIYTLRDTFYSILVEMVKNGIRNGATEVKIEFETNAVSIITNSWQIKDPHRIFDLGYSSGGPSNKGFGLWFIKKSLEKQNAKIFLKHNEPKNVHFKIKFSSQY